jgi:hypothetical protein
MHTLRICAFALVAFGLMASEAHAESRTFIIPSNADGYGVDRCLAKGEQCGMTVATAYCQSRSFAQAKSFRRLDRDEITGAVPSGNACAGAACDSFVAIICSR